jgi:hypothetical protein
MGNLIIGKILRGLGRRLDGYKTTIGGIGMIATGLAGLIGYVFPDQPDLPRMDLDEALGLMAGGFAVLGIGGKLEKARADLNGRQGP